MRLLKPVLAAVFLLGPRVFAGDPVAITNWLPFGQADAAVAVAEVRDATISLAGGDQKGSTFWSVFDPIPLAGGKPVTLSFRLATPDDFPEMASAEIRIGLYGVVEGTSPHASKQADLRGFIVMGGSQKSMWRIELAEHAASQGSLIHRAGMTNRAATQVSSRGGRGAESRVVITLARKSAELVSVGGFWGEVPFAFEVRPLAGDYTHLRAIAVMRGGKSGEGELKISGVKIRAD